jgi:hypothetical protein
MPLFTPDQLQNFANLFQDLGMMDACTVERLQTTDVPYGQKTSPIVVIETVCLVSEPPGTASALLAQIAEKLGSRTIWHVFMPLGIDVRHGDILTIKGQKMTVQVELAPKSFAVSSNFLASEVR